MRILFYINALAWLCRVVSMQINLTVKLVQRDAYTCYARASLHNVLAVEEKRALVLYYPYACLQLGRSCCNSDRLRRGKLND